MRYFVRKDFENGERFVLPVSAKLKEIAGLSEAAAKAIWLQAEFDFCTKFHYVEFPKNAECKIGYHSRFDNQKYTLKELERIEILQSQYVALVYASHRDGQLQQMRENSLLTIEKFVPANKKGWLGGLPMSPAEEIAEAAKTRSYAICG